MTALHMVIATAGCVIVMLDLMALTAVVTSLRHVLITVLIQTTDAVVMVTHFISKAMSTHTVVHINVENVCALLPSPGRAATVRLMLVLLIVTLQMEIVHVDVVSATLVSEEHTVDAMRPP
jgi:hypothetical protein